MQRNCATAEPRDFSRPFVYLFVHTLPPATTVSRDGRRAPDGGPCSRTATLRTRARVPGHRECSTEYVRSRPPDNARPYRDPCIIIFTITIIIADCIITEERKLPQNNTKSFFPLLARPFTVGPNLATAAHDAQNGRSSVCALSTRSRNVLTPTKTVSTAPQWCCALSNCRVAHDSDCDAGSVDNLRDARPFICSTCRRQLECSKFRMLHCLPLFKRSYSNTYRAAPELVAAAVLSPPEQLLHPRRTEGSRLPSPFSIFKFYLQIVWTYRIVDAYTKTWS